ncbi:MAG: BtrH N-terminal domain-containing protein [Oscillospiraceae bacterium]|nr:BtrH N-terminal domain-containing protein [Oscillospiraceae bacterium]
MVEAKQVNTIPYRICDYVHIQQIGEFTFYINLVNSGHYVLSNDMHECITSGSIEFGDGLVQYAHSTINKLVTLKYIEPDLENICIGKASIYIPRKKWKPGGEINHENLAKLLEKEYHNPIFKIEQVDDSRDVSVYEYLCGRNSLRVALQGYGIKSPLLWMRAGLFVDDVDFTNTGEFTTNFSRSMIDAANIPILGDLKSSLDWDIIDAHLEKRLPVLVHVDIYYMPYERNIFFHNRHGAHVIVLLEKCDDAYLIVDWAHPSYYYGEITKDELTIARTSANEKDQVSVFNGYPISATYQRLYLNRFSRNLNISQHVMANLYQSAKSMLSDNGIISLLERARATTPEWIKVPGHDSYGNAIESFFFLDLELKFLCLYYEEMLTADSCNVFYPEILLEKVIGIRNCVDLLKNKLILAMRRNKSIEEEAWTKLLCDIKMHTVEYCETVLKLLKAMKSAKHKESKESTRN